MAIGVAFGVIVWYGIFITLWVQGTKEHSTVMLFVGAFFTLFIIGLIIAAIQYLSWTNPYSKDYQGNVTPLLLSKGSQENENKEDKLKKAFLDGIISAEEYNKKLNDLNE